MSTRRRAERRAGLLALAAALALFGGDAMAIEEPEYTVDEEDGDFQVRQYPGYLVAEMLVESNFEKAGNEAFRPLARYIGGANRSKAKISMTAPVTQEPASAKISMTAPVTQEEVGGRYRIAFVMPAEYTLDTLPEPTDERITLRAEPGRRVAVIRYSGFWSRGRYDDHLAKLRAWMAERGLGAAGDPIWARYNPPFMPWFLRRNEIQIPVAASAGS